MATIDIAAQAAAGVTTPSTGVATVFIDSTTKALKSKNDAGVVTDYTAPGNAISSLTGDVTATGPGAAAATIPDATVTSKLLTGLSGAVSGTPVATDTILAAIGKLTNKFNSIAWFCNGSDGIQTLTVDTTLVRDMYYDTLTINPTVTLFAAGFRVSVLNTLTNNGTINRSGNAATTNTGAVGLVAGTTGIGGTGGSGGGAAAGAAGAGTTSSIGTAGGAGGTGSGGAGGAAGAVTVPTAALGGVEQMNAVRTASIARDLAGTVLNGGSGAGGGGGGGAAGSGGGGGAGGGVLVIAAQTLMGNGIIEAHGGNGANAVLANGGGGGGGGGGVIAVITSNDTTATSLTFQVFGGTGGAGNGVGTNGATGSAGRLFRLRV